MADLGNKIISQNYQKLLQITDNGLVADGSGSAHTLHINGTETYQSGSGANTDLTRALVVTGSIIPEGSGSWDLGSFHNPFRDLWITEDSIRMRKKDGSVTEFKESDVSAFLRGEVSQRIDDTGKRITTKPGYSKLANITAFNDTNTTQTFTTDRIYFKVGGRTYLDIDEDEGYIKFGEFATGAMHLGNPNPVISSSNDVYVQGDIKATGRLYGDGSTLSNIAGTDDPFELDGNGDLMLRDVTGVNHHTWAMTNQTDVYLKTNYFQVSGLYDNLTQEQLDSVVIIG